MEFIKYYNYINLFINKLQFYELNNNNKKINSVKITK
jgi:hypothetical protein